MTPERTSTAQGVEPDDLGPRRRGVARGCVVPARSEVRWLNAWGFSQRVTCVFNEDLYVVTPHGWTGVLDAGDGRAPRGGLS